MKNKSQPLSAIGQVARLSALCLMLPAFSTLSVNAEELVEPVVALAQQAKTVHGTVVDQSGIPIIGANVLVKGTTLGSITDMDGKFVIEGVPSDAVLEISYIGYKTQNITVGSKSQFNVTLSEDSESLDEVVVVGYGTQKKVTVTGSVASVSSEATPFSSLSATAQDALQSNSGWVYAASASIDLPDGVYAGTVTTREYHPLALLFGRE